MPRIKPEKDLTNEEKELFSIAENIADAANTELRNHAVFQINSHIQKHNGISQVNTLSFLYKIFSLIACEGVLLMKDICDQNADNEHTKQCLFDEFIDGLYLTMGMTKKERKGRSTEIKGLK